MGTGLITLVTAMGMTWSPETRTETSGVIWQSRLFATLSRRGGAGAVFVYAGRQADALSPGGVTELPVQAYFQVASRQWQPRSPSCYG